MSLEVVQPADAAGVAAQLKRANGEGLAVAIQGAGTKQDWGEPASRADVVLSTLRLNAPRTALAIAVTPVLAELARRHPGLTVEVTADDGLADIVAQGFDAGIRLGHTVAHDMVAVRLTPPFHSIMVAAPAYLAARGTPRRLDDLDRHNCIGYRFVTSGAVYD